MGETQNMGEVDNFTPHCGWTEEILLKLSVRLIFLCIYF